MRPSRTTWLLVTTSPSARQAVPAPAPARERTRTTDCCTAAAMPDASLQAAPRVGTSIVVIQRSPRSCRLRLCIEDRAAAAALHPPNGQVPLLAIRAGTG